MCPQNEKYEQFTANKTVFIKLIGGPSEWLVAIGTMLVLVPVMSSSITVLITGTLVNDNYVLRKLRFYWLN